MSNITLYEAMEYINNYLVEASKTVELKVDKYGLIPLLLKLVVLL
jgi:hypothetical protein